MVELRMLGVSVSALLLCACALGADVGAPPQRDVDSQAQALSAQVTKPTRDYYAVRRDMRRCASPRCGGYFLRGLNLRTTTCADGTAAEECYVAELTTPDGVSFEDGDIVHGSLRVIDYPALSVQLGGFDADAVLSPVLRGVAEPADHALVSDTGVRCVRSPCPSLALAKLNTGSSTTNFSLRFDAADEPSVAALEAAYTAELASSEAFGSGAVVAGAIQNPPARRGRPRQARATVRNVYTVKPQLQPACVAVEEDTRVTAWNFKSLTEAQEFANNLSGEVAVYKGRCSEQALACPEIYSPVHGVIDALGDGCVEFSNRCEFRAAVINAAGAEAKAGGSFEAGLCAAQPVPCETEMDCKDGFCGFDAAGAQVCKPFAQVGEHCEGFVLPANWRICAPELKCRPFEETGDAGGVCLLPGDRFPCGDQGLLCEYGKQYCQVIVGGQPNPQTGEAILSYSCVNESTCSVLDEACACLESQVQPGGASCDDNGLLPPIVTFFAP